jgi:hypothetical protein
MRQTASSDTFVFLFAVSSRKLVFFERASQCCPSSQTAQRNDCDTRNLPPALSALRNLFPDTFFFCLPVVFVVEGVCSFVDVFCLWRIKKSLFSCFLSHFFCPDRSGSFQSLLAFGMSKLFWCRYQTGR